MGFETEGDVGFEVDVEPVNIAVTEPGERAVPAPKLADELGLVVSGYEPYYTLLSEIAAWDSGASLGVVFEPRAGLVAAFETEYVMVPREHTQTDLSEALPGVLLGPTVTENERVEKSETVELEIFAEDMTGEWLDFVVLVWVAIAEMVTEPESKPGDKAEAVL